MGSVCPINHRQNKIHTITSFGSTLAAKSYCDEMQEWRRAVRVKLSFDLRNGAQNYISPFLINSTTGERGELDEERMFVERRFRKSLSDKPNFCSGPFASRNRVVNDVQLFMVFKTVSIWSHYHYNNNLNTPIKIHNEDSVALCDKKMTFPNQFPQFFLSPWLNGWVSRVNPPTNWPLLWYLTHLTNHRLFLWEWPIWRSETWDTSKMPHKNLFQNINIIQCSRPKEHFVNRPGDRIEKRRKCRSRWWAADPNHKRNKSVLTDSTTGQSASIFLGWWSNSWLIYSNYLSKFIIWKRWRKIPPLIPYWCPSLTTPSGTNCLTFL